MESSSNVLNAFLGSGTEYGGRLEFLGTVRIDGVFRGEIMSEGSLVLGREAVIEGQVRVGTLISNGRVKGDVVVASKAILQNRSMLEGSLRTGALVVEEGAAIEGTVEMTSRGPGETVKATPILDAAADSAAPALDDDVPETAETVVQDLDAAEEEDSPEAERPGETVAGEARTDRVS